VLRRGFSSWQAMLRILEGILRKVDTSSCESGNAIVALIASSILFVSGS
jgi:hypothetical protein